MEQHKNVTVFDTAEELSTAAAQFICDRAEENIKARGSFTIALSGGSTPEKLFKLLSSLAYADAIDWSKVFVFWGDERAVPLDDDQNNAKTAKALLLDKVNIPDKNVYRIASDLPAADAASEYEKSIRRFFGAKPISFDLVLLGMGADGHTASLFPHSPALQAGDKLVTSFYLQEQKMDRITFTAPLINDAAVVLFLVAGESKAEVLPTILSGPTDTDSYPAQMINPHSGGLYWYIDKDAAKLL